MTLKMRLSVISWNAQFCLQSLSSTCRYPKKICLKSGVVRIYWILKNKSNSNKSREIGERSIPRLRLGIALLLGTRLRAPWFVSSSPFMILSIWGTSTLSSGVGNKIDKLGAPSVHFKSTHIRSIGKSLMEVFLLCTWKGLLNEYGTSAGILWKRVSRCTKSKNTRQSSMRCSKDGGSKVRECWHLRCWSSLRKGSIKTSTSPFKTVTIHSTALPS